jgi:hypothetical protein
VPHPFFAAVGGIVPQNLPLLRGDHGRHRGADDGWLDRMLFSYPAEVEAGEENWLEVNQYVAQDFRGFMARLRILEMVVEDKDGVEKPRPFVIGMDRAARGAYREFTRVHAAELSDPSFPRHLCGPWSKLKGYVGRLALIVHYLRWAANDGPTEKGDLDGESMARAVRLIDYFKGHARKVYAVLGTDWRVRPAQRILHWAYSHHRARFSKRDAYRAAPTWTGRRPSTRSSSCWSATGGFAPPTPLPGGRGGPAQFTFFSLWTLDRMDKTPHSNVYSFTRRGSFVHSVQCPRRGRMKNRA